MIPLPLPLPTKAGIKSAHTKPKSQFETGPVWTLVNLAFALPPGGGPGPSGNGDKFKARPETEGRHAATRGHLHTHNALHTSRLHHLKEQLLFLKFFYSF